jgi:hypothetical protein
MQIGEAYSSKNSISENVQDRFIEMAKVGAQRAAELTGKSKSTIQRAMNAGKPSYEVDAHQRRLIDVSELERVFGLQSQSASENASEGGSSASGAEIELERARHAIELERMKMEVRLAQEQRDAAQQQVEDLKIQRDLWQKQAQQILITSQYSQKQSEERISELQAREDARKAQMESRRMQQGSVPSARPSQPAQIRPQQAAPQSQSPSRPAAAAAESQQGPVFRTVAPGNQNRNPAQPEAKTSLFASLFGNKRKA